MMSRKFYISGLFSVMLFTAAGTTVTHAQENTDGDVGRGAVAWSNNCDRCHNMRQPNEFTDNQWRPIISHMRIRAGLTGQEARDILKFLQANN